jgi:hypothetical protein
MSTTPDPPNAVDPLQQPEPAWWLRVLDIDADQPESAPSPEPVDDGSFPEITVDEAATDNSGERLVAASDGTYTPEMLNAVATALRHLPPLHPSQRRLDRRGVVSRLRQTILTVQRRGYTLDQIAEALTASGFAIKGSTLKVYLGRSKRGRRRHSGDTRGLPLVLRGRIRG